MKTIQTLEEFHATFAPKPVEVEVAVPNMEPFKVFLKPLTSEQRDAFEASVVGVDGKRDLSNLRARLVSGALCNAEGKRLGPAKELGQDMTVVMDAIFDIVRKMNGMDGEKAIEEAGKELGGTLD